MTGVRGFPAARPRGRFLPSGWAVAAGAIAAVIGLPLLPVAWLALFPSENIWPHLAETVLPRYVTTTLWLMAAVGAGTAVVGVGTAWLVATCEFPGRRVLKWALVLPLAMPAYVVAYVYTDLLEYAGPVQRALRDLFGWRDAGAYRFPEIRSLGGAAAMLTATLYPYVYLLSRAAFAAQTGGIIEAARTLGCNAREAFRRIALPMARPSIVVGLALVMMETLSDFGTVDYFSVQTLTTGVFNVWLIMNNTGGGAQISMVMLVFVAGLLLMERAARRQRRYHDTTRHHVDDRAYVLSPGRGLLALAACAVPVLVGFAIPAGVLLSHAVEFHDAATVNRYLDAARNSIVLSALAAAAAVLVGRVLAYATRTTQSRAVLGLARFASLGYAVPGAVLALGILAPFGAFDNAVDGFARSAFGIGTGLLLSGTVFALVFAYVARFLALTYGTLEAGLGRVTPNIDHAARTLGHGATRTLLRVNLPMIRGSVLTAALLIFVDSMKELPATLLLRPFNFETLATHVYQLASDELLEECALGAVTIVAFGVLPVILLTHAIGSASPHNRPERDPGRRRAEGARADGGAGLRRLSDAVRRRVATERRGRRAG